MSSIGKEGPTIAADMRDQKKNGSRPHRRLAATAILTMVLMVGGEIEGKPREKGSRGVMTSLDLVSVKSISDPRISRDGRYLVYTLTSHDAKTNKSRSDLYIGLATGGGARRLCSGKGSSFHPRWSPDGKHLAFVSTREHGAQLWILPVGRPGEARRITNVRTGVSGPVWSFDSRRILFTSQVHPECRTQACNSRVSRQKKSDPVKAQIFTKLLYRHWNHYRNGRVNHLLAVDLPPEGSQGVPEAFDLTPGQEDVPPVALGSSNDYAFSPDGRLLCFVKNTDRLVAASTNNDLFCMPARGGKPWRITTNKANDNGVLFSPDRRYIAFRAMRRPGFEADRTTLRLFDLRTRKIEELTGKLDRSVDEMVWSPRGDRIYFTAEEMGYKMVYEAPVNGGTVRRVVDKVYARYLRISPDGKSLYFVSESTNDPPELFRYELKSRKLHRLTGWNRWLVRDRSFGKLTSFWFNGAAGRKVHAFLLWPPVRATAGKKKIPVVLMIHGGPQNMQADSFHPRWNSALFAASGYAILMINFHGSTGYGQAFTDAISGDWGGKPYKDVMLGLAAALARYKRLDGKRVCAVGASYGGYLINWIGGHSSRFRCLVSHSGVYNLEAKYGTTEELWFPEWEFRGPPWGPTKRTQYARWSPHNYVGRWMTPTLIVHGQHDYRVTVGQGMQLFTALQRRGVPSKFLYFPDEDHFVQKPRNRLLWWKVVMDWLGQHLKR